MTFREETDAFVDSLRSRKGGLIRLMADLYWYEAECWDHSAGTVCLILNADVASRVIHVAEGANFSRTDFLVHAGLQILLDGKPVWIWINKADVETID